MNPASENKQGMAIGQYLVFFHSGVDRMLDSDPAIIGGSKKPRRKEAGLIAGKDANLSRYGPQR